MSANRQGKDGNFEQVDQKCAEQWNKESRDGKTDWTARDVANWRCKKEYSWHECNNIKTCQLIPTEINVWGSEVELEVVVDCYEGEEYCLRRNAEDIGSPSIDNAFKYVVTKSICVYRTTDGSHVVGLMFAYKFNIENGIAVVFNNEKLDKVGTKDAFIVILLSRPVLP